MDLIFKKKIQFCNNDDNFFKKITASFLTTNLKKSPKLKKQLNS